jgi:hypothetical protein
MMELDNSKMKLERVRWLVEIWKAMQKVLRPFWMGRLSNE